VPDIDTLRARLTEFCHRLYQRDLVGSTEGNASVKIDLNRFLITPTGSNLGYIEPEDSVILSTGGKRLAGDKAPSSEYHLHLGIYQHRWDIAAVCHAHPIAATACATSGIALDRPILPEVISTFGIIPLVDYGTPGTLELFDKMADLVGRYDAFLLKSHGVVTLGADLDDAFNKMEMVERCARIIITAKLLGNIQQLPEEIVRKLPGFEVLESQLQPGDRGKDYSR